MKLEIKNLCLNYEKNVNIINNLSLTNEGHSLCVFGDKDCGKSLLAQCICGLEKFRGEIYFDNERLDNKNLNISLILKPLVFFENKSVLQNISYAIKFYSKQKSQILNKTQLLCQINNIIEQFGLESIQNFKLKNLNSGQRKIVALARASIKSPRILVCDELFENESKQNQMQLSLLINKYFKNSYVLFTAYLPNLYESLCQDFAYMKFGRIIKLDKISCFSNLNTDIYLYKLFNDSDSYDAYLNENTLYYNDTFLLLNNNICNMIHTEAINNKKLLVFCENKSIIVFDKLTGDRLCVL